MAPDKWQGAVFSLAGSRGFSKVQALVELLEAESLVQKPAGGAGVGVQHCQLGLQGDQLHLQGVHLVLQRFPHLLGFIPEVVNLVTTFLAGPVGWREPEDHAEQEEQEEEDRDGQLEGTLQLQLQLDLLEKERDGGAGAGLQ